MKIFPIILAAILFASAINPCKAKLPCHDKESKEMESCHMSEKTHACCMAPAETEQEQGQDHDHKPKEGDPCTDGCACYCCFLVVAPYSNNLASNEKLITNQRQSWEPSIYAHEFTHFIWQPPKLHFRIS